MKTKAIFNLLLFLLFLITHLDIGAQSFGLSNSGSGNFMIISQPAESSSEVKASPKKVLQDLGYFDLDEENALLIYTASLEYLRSEQESLDADYSEELVEFLANPNPEGTREPQSTGNPVGPQGPMGQGTYWSDRLGENSEVMMMSLIREMRGSIELYDYEGKKSTTSESSESGSNEKFVIDGGSMSKAISGTATKQFDWPKSKHNREGLIGISAKFQAEEDFTNIFTDGKISSNGGLGLTLGIGQLPEEFKLGKDDRVVGNQDDPYWLIHGGFHFDFSQINNVENPAVSLSIENSKNSLFNGRIGFNKYSVKRHLQSGFSYSFGKQINRGALTKQKITKIIESKLDSTLSIIQQTDVLTGVVNSVSYHNVSYDALLYPKGFKLIALYANANYNNFPSLDEKINDKVALNLGVIFNKQDKDNKNLYSPKFGFVFGWSDLFDMIEDEENSRNFNFGITAVFGFNSFNSASPPKSSENEK